YDGANAVQELTSVTPVTPTANSVAGGIDEIFSRADATGSYAPLTDGLGSTIALSDSSANAPTQFSYEPFGATTQLGAANSDTSQYTGRENDGGGIYYYRARYYSTTLGRFISQDPIGFRGGGNLYAYAHDNPIRFKDPRGKDGLDLAIGSVWP